MNILSFQSFSLYENGGGSRILRRLYEGHECNILSIAVLTHNKSIPNQEIKETIVHAIPITRWWFRWRLHKWVDWLRNTILYPYTVDQIQKTAAKLDFEVIHLVDHGPFSKALARMNSKSTEKNLWVSFHDHYLSSGGSFENTSDLWRQADRRLVISEELGNEYQRIFGDKKYEIITDGLKLEEISKPLDSFCSPIIIYFAGLLHVDYLPLFKILADAVDSLSNPERSFKIILRGTQRIHFLENRSFGLEYKPFTIDERELKAEINSASILYLPIKFTNPNFFLYSLSTKMVGYLGGAGAILYHGPKNSAACTLLKAFNAAAFCTSLDFDDLSSSIKFVIEDQQKISENAKLLANEKFNLETIKSKFWQNFSSQPNS